jgi:hypothetical protein
MAYLDFIKNRNAGPQKSVAPAPQPEVQTSRSVESLPANVKAQAVETAKPIAEIAGKASQPQDVPAAPQAPSATPARGRSLGQER